MTESKLGQAELRERGHRLLQADHFVALGVNKGTQPDDVRKAFVELAKTWHPDQTPKGHEDLRPLLGKVFARLETARNVLVDPARRMKYIEELTRPAKASDVSLAEAGLDFKKAEALFKKNDLQQGEIHLRRAMQLAPENVEYQAFHVALKAKPSSSPEELKKLVVELDRLILRDSDCERAYFVRGQLRKRLDLHKEAFLDFNRAAELNPKNIDAVREVRIHRMRHGEAKDEPEKEGFFKRLFKR